MSCKHEWDEPESKDTYCTICGKSTNEVRLEQQLAAANARIAELENQVEQEKLNSFSAVWKRAYDDCRCPVCGSDEWHKPGCQFAEIVNDAIESKCEECDAKQRADIANTEIEKLRREIAELRRGEGSAE